MPTYYVSLLPTLAYNKVRSLSVLLLHWLTYLSSEQNALLLQSPASLTSLLSITLAHNWLLPTLHVMHLHAYLAQALLPGDSPLLQFPGVRKDDLEPGVEVAELVEELEKKADPRLESIRKAGERWGHLEVVDVRFKGERFCLICTADSTI
jgi:translocation protein SEC63